MKQCAVKQSKVVKQTSGQPWNLLPFHWRRLAGQSEVRICKTKLQSCGRQKISVFTLRHLGQHWLLLYNKLIYRKRSTRVFDQQLLSTHWLLLNILMNIT